MKADPSAKIRRICWRSLVPSRDGWLALFVAPSSYLLLLCFAATIVAKGKILRDIDGVSSWPITWLWAIGSDLFFFGLLASLFAIAETMRRWTAVVSGLLTVLFVGLGAINAWYLFETGDQMTWQTLTTGIDRFGDVMNIASESLSTIVIYGVLGTAVLASFPGVIYLRYFRRPGRPLFSQQLGRTRAHCAATGAVLGALLWLALPGPDVLHAAKLGGNGILNTYRGFGKSVPKEDSETRRKNSFTGYQPAYLVTPDSLKKIARGPRPNVILFALESTRFDHTELAPAAEQHEVSTPNLRALAERGVQFTHARAILPHTSKSLFSMLCARYPTMQRWIVETADNIPVQCLPSILRAAGYRTGFFQSALGIFEHRPRLVHKFGFEDFFAYEEIQGEPLGYLASDDESLGPFALEWIGKAEGPFFATLLTSGAHHPYRVGKTIRERAKASGLSLDSVEDRYKRLVEAEDQLIGAVVKGLEEKGLLENTIIVVAGDHGEGFGKKGVRQHDNNFFEEGLRVPLVFAGPGFSHQRFDENVSLADITPTILGRLDVAVANEAIRGTAGADLLSSPIPHNRPLAFTCWYEQRCRGFVVGDEKVVMSPERGEAYYFDLAKDPQEKRAQRVPKHLLQLTKSAASLMDSYRTHRFRPRFREVRYGEWHCPEEEARCRHPRAQGLRNQN